MSEQSITISLTETQMKVLEQFIGRVNLNAKEVAAFNDLMGALQQGAPQSEVGVAPNEVFEEE